MLLSSNHFFWKLRLSVSPVELLSFLKPCSRLQASLLSAPREVASEKTGCKGDICDYQLVFASFISQYPLLLPPTQEGWMEEWIKGGMSLLNFLFVCKAAWFLSVAPPHLYGPIQTSSSWCLCAHIVTDVEFWHCYLIKVQHTIANAPTWNNTGCHLDLHVQYIHTSDKGQEKST